MHSTTVVPVFWGTKWSDSTFTADKVTGLDYFYSHVGGTPYLHTNSEYTDNSGNVNTTNVSKASADKTDFNATPSGAPSTSAVLAEVAKVTGNNPVPGAYYPVYSDQPRGQRRLLRVAQLGHDQRDPGGVRLLLRARRGLGLRPEGADEPRRTARASRRSRT